MAFDYTLNFKNLDFRKNPELYKIGKGEQGVLLVEPYKSELLPFWRFKNPEIAEDSANKIYELFKDYIKANDFVGADMARKFIQMGYTRARRYANHKSGRKYSENPQLESSVEAEKKARKENLLPNEEDPVKAAAAAIFKAKWEIVKQDAQYISMKKEHELKYGK